LLEAVAGAARAFDPDGRMLPCQSLISVLARMTQAPINDAAGLKEVPFVPECWQPCDIEKLQNLCGLFDHAPRTGTVDCVEFLVHIGLMHSPLGWPSLDTLKEVRRYLESKKPGNMSWPDFSINEETFTQIPIFADPSGLEDKLAAEFRPDAADPPPPTSCPRAVALAVQSIQILPSTTAGETSVRARDGVV